MKTWLTFSCNHWPRLKFINLWSYSDSVWCDWMSMRSCKVMLTLKTQGGVLEYFWLFACSSICHITHDTSHMILNWELDDPHTSAFNNKLRLYSSCEILQHNTSESIPLNPEPSDFPDGFGVNSDDDAKEGVWYLTGAWRSTSGHKFPTNSLLEESAGMEWFQWWKMQ